MLYETYRASSLEGTQIGSVAQVVRFAMCGSMTPPVEDTLQWGEAARMTAMSRYGGQNDDGASPTLSGKDHRGHPLQEQHKHAFYLPTDEDGDGLLDHLTIWSPVGLDAKEFHAVVSMDRMWLPGRREEAVQLAYLKHGHTTDFAGESPIFDKATCWRSLTPYVLTRYIKYRGQGKARHIVKDGPKAQLAREMSQRYPDWPSMVERRYDPEGAIAPMHHLRESHSGIRPGDFSMQREGSGSYGGRAYGFEIEFSDAVQGPLALGYACHYGLGLFVPSIFQPSRANPSPESRGAAVC